MDKKLSGLLLAFFLLFTVFASVVLLSSSGQLTTFTRAKEDFAASAKASLLFAYPLLVKADGKTASTISVFIRSDKGMPVKDKKVVVTASLGDLNAVEVTTDEKGKATVTLTSISPGTSVIGATVDGATKLTQPLSIIFE